MGTNYYLKSPPCQACGKSDDPLHIGKSSAGWCFSLHVIPDRGLVSLEAWGREWTKLGLWIEDECGTKITDTEMLGIILNRRMNPHNQFSPQWLADNYAMLGPNNLARSRIDGSHCVGHGDGTYDLIAGEFS
jgi:hypothetical protein